MFKKVISTFALSLIVAASAGAQTVQSYQCGTGTIDKIHAGGFGDEEIYLSINSNGVGSPSFYDGATQTLRFDPELGADHKNRVYSTLLMALATNKEITLQSHTLNALGVPDCSKMDQVTISSF